MDRHPDAVSFLNAHSPFAGVAVTTIKMVASRCRSTSRQPGESIFREGDPCRDLYVLVAGRVKCFRASPEGREQILKIFERAGDIFCATSAFSTGSHIVTAEAMSEVSLYVIDVETMKRVALEHPVVALALVTATGDQMRSLVSLADDLSLKTATTRVAKLLWERGRAQGGRKGREVRLPRASLREDDIARWSAQFESTCRGASRRSRRWAPSRSTGTRFASRIWRPSKASCTPSNLKLEGGLACSGSDSGPARSN
jgi:CRP-like cAMP-binding protein